MKKIILHFAAAFAAGVCLASPVTKEQARLAVRGWISHGAALGANFGSTPLDPVAHVTTNGATFYTVATLDGGTVFLTGDTKLAPVVGFTSEKTDFSTIDPRSPLWAILNNDMSALAARAGTLAQAQPALCSLAALAAVSPATDEERAWSELIEEGEAQEQKKVGFLSVDPIEETDDISDLRVAPLVESKWNQASVTSSNPSSPLYDQEVACYNYYTPSGTATVPVFEEGNVSNSCCGCTATAIGQVMRYYKIDTKIEPFTNECHWGASEVPTNLVCQGGEYDWDKMTLVPVADADFDVPNAQAIGRLLSDIGVALGASYNVDGTNYQGSTGASSYDVPDALDVLGFTSHHMFQDQNFRSDWSKEEGFRSNLMERVFFANFDAGCPVIMGILRGMTTDGHAVVGDGYGFRDGLDYVHINMGWGGQNDFWYHVPSMGYYTVLRNAYYNLFWKSDECLQKGIISGRVLNSESNVVANALVEIYEKGNDSVYEVRTTTDERGIWSARLFGGTYTLRARNGSEVCEIRDVVLAAPTDTSSGVSGKGIVQMITDEENLGNSWGNDIVLQDAVAMIGNIPYASLTHALASASDNCTIELLKPTVLEAGKSLSVTSCVIRTAEGVSPENARISHAGAVLNLVGNAYVTFQDVQFENDLDNPTTISVEAGSTLAVSGKVALGYVETANANGFVLAGAVAPVEPGIFIKCAAAQADGSKFGTYTCSESDATGCAHRLLNGYDPEYAGVTDGANLVWSSTAPVDENDAVAAVGGQNYRTLDRALENATDTVTIRKSVTSSAFKKIKAVTSSFTVCCPSSTNYVVMPAPTAGFAVDGGTLTVKNVTFRGFTGGNEAANVFITASGSGSAVVVDDGATFVNFTGNYEQTGCTIVAKKGAKVTVNKGATFENCCAYGAKACGGAIYLSSNCTLELGGGSGSAACKFAGCHAAYAGGAVYVWGVNSTVHLSGWIEAANNTCHNRNYNEKAVEKSNIYFANAASDFSMTDDLWTSWSDAIGIGFAGDAGVVGGRLGDRFIKVGSGVSNPHCQTFVNDGNDKLVAAVTNIGEQAWLYWAAAADDEGQCAESEAKARIVHATDPSVTNYYKTVKDAFGHLKGDATVYVTSTEYTGDFAISNRVVLLPYEASSVTLTRKVDWSVDVDTKEYLVDDDIRIVSGGSLVISNIVFKGNADWAKTAAFRVNGGSLTLGGGATLQNLKGNFNRACGAVVVWNDGTFTMEEGSQILSCANGYVSGYRKSEGVYDGRKAANDGIGGGLLVENGTAYLKGGFINKCYTSDYVTNAAGVFIGNEGKAYLSGKLDIYGNGTPCRDLVVADKGYIYLDGALTSSDGVRIHYDVQADTNLAARVSWTGWTLADLKTSAAKIKKGVDAGNPSVTGTVVTNGTEALIVWPSSKTSYTDGDGNKFQIASVPNGFTLSSVPAPLKGGSFTLPNSYVAAQGEDPESQEEEDGIVTLSFGAGTAGCWYYLYSSETLGDAATWTLVAEKHIENNGDPVDFTDEKGTGDSKFWKVVAEQGLVQEQK